MLLLLDGKKYEEIAEVTGFTNSNVGNSNLKNKTKIKNTNIK